MRININNTAKIDAALEAVNGRATSHTVTSASDVRRIAASAESRLAPIAKARRRGASVAYRPSGPGKAYARKGHHVITTRITLERGASGWFLTGCERCEMWSDSPELFAIRVTPDQRDEIVSAALEGFVWL